MERAALYFIVYSFIGWIVESLFRSVVEKGRPVNSGFLFGPFIPVYGFGALVFVVMGEIVSPLPFAVQLVLFTLSATVLEYATSVLLEKLFGMKLWDYSNFPINDSYHINLPLNINGRVCLLFSLFWAGLIAFQILILHPLVAELVTTIPSRIRYSVVFVFFVYLGIDLNVSARLYYNFSKFLTSVKQMQAGKITGELKSRLHLLSSVKVMNTFFRPLRAFPHLRDQLSKAWEKIPRGTHLPYLRDVKDLIREKLPVLNMKKKTENLKDFFALANPVLTHPEYQKLKNIKHHDKDIYTHNVSVAWISYILARRLHLRVEEVVRGALLHDFFFYDWRKYRDRDYILPHGFSHPTISYKNAVKIFGKLTPREKDIILKHMWPLTVIPPRFRESFLVSMVDKTIASREALRAVIPLKKDKK